MSAAAARRLGCSNRACSRRGRSDSSNWPSRAVASRSMASSTGTAFGMALLCLTMVDAPLYVAWRGIIPRLLRFMHGGPEAFQGLVLGAPDGLLGDLKQLGHHINRLFVLIQEVPNRPLTIGEHPQWDGRILQITRFQGSLGGFEGSIIQFCARPTVRPSFEPDRWRWNERPKSARCSSKRGWDRKSEEAVRRLSAGVRTRLGLHLQCPVRFGHEAPAGRPPTPDRRTPKRNPQTPGCHLGRKHPNQPGRGWDQARAVSYDRPLQNHPQGVDHVQWCLWCGSDMARFVR